MPFRFSIWYVGTISAIIGFTMSLGYFTGVFFWINENPNGFLQTWPLSYSSLYSHSGYRSTLQRVERANELYEDMRQKRYDILKRAGPGHLLTSGFTGAFEMMLWDYFPPSWTCPHELTRVGNIGDGGKWVCGADRIVDLKSCTIYSFGVERKSAFEAEFLRRSNACRLWAYDFTVTEIGPEIRNNVDYNSRTVFRPYRFDVVDVPAAHTEPEKRSLHGLLKENGHEWVDILKVDIESGEFDVLMDIVSHYKGRPLPFGQLQLEIHAWKGNFGHWVEWFHALEDAGLRPFSFELNFPDLNYEREPKVIEYGFINVGIPHALLDDSFT